MPTKFLKPGGGFGGAEAPVRRAIEIGQAHGLTLTSTKRANGNSGSDHHVSQTRSFACDLSNGSSPTPQMEATARAIATKLGHPEFRTGILNVTQGALRAQLIWGTHDHLDHVHYGVRVNGVVPVPDGLPRLTTPNMRGARIKRIQQRLNALGFGPLDTDGIFGPATDAAVRAFQQAKGLDADGVVGPLTQAALK
jgi:hypothetical protein